ncbi:MAG: pyridoxal phosphate-dependent aminotransferase [Candidatus Sumerlaeaceae bacterium]
MSESVTLAIDAKCKAMMAQGVDVVNFAAGEPDFDTPGQVKEAAKAALDAGKTKYVASGGLPDLKSAICDKLRSDNGLDYKPSQILVSIGAKHSLFNIIMTIVDQGDQVLIPSPYWVSYYDMVHAAEGVPVLLPTTAEQDFKITPEQLEASITPRTVAIILNSPSNPTGAVYTEQELRALAAVIIKNNILCISDEIYEKLMYDGVKHFSIAATSPEMKDRTLVVNGFSKAFSMTGWRLGYTAGPQEIMSAMNTLQSHSTSNATTFAQWGGVEAMRNTADDVEKMRAAFDERRKVLVVALNEIPGVRCNLPRGAFYAFPDMSAHFGKSFNGTPITGSMELAEYLLMEGRVSIVPGIAFGAEKHMRFSYANSMENLKRGVERIREALGKLD